MLLYNLGYLYIFYVMMKESNVLLIIIYFYLILIFIVYYFNLFKELPDQAPQVVIELANTEAYEGTVGRFKCRFYGQPEPQVKW